LMITTAALGIKAIGKLAYIAVPLLVLGISYALSTLFSTSDSTQILAYIPNKPIPFGAAVGTVVGGWIVGASMNADYARFARNTKHAIAYALAHYSFNYPLLLIVCGVMAIGFNTNDIVSHLVPPQLSWLLLVLMMLATWAANDCNLYSSSLSLTVLTGASRAKLAILAGIAGILLAEFRLAQNMVSFLVLLGVFIAPIGGVFIVNDSNMESEADETTAFKWVPISAWLTGAFIGVLTTPKEALGLGLFKITGISTLDAVLVAAALMLLFQKIVKHR